jgi:hypothetical protein
VSHAPPAQATGALAAVYFLVSSHDVQVPWLRLGYTTSDGGNLESGIGIRLVYPHSPAMIFTQLRFLRSWESCQSQTVGWPWRCHRRNTRRTFSALTIIRPAQKTIPAMPRRRSRRSLATNRPIPGQRWRREKKRVRVLCTRGANPPIPAARIQSRIQQKSNVSPCPRSPCAPIAPFPVRLRHALHEVTAGPASILPAPG